MMACILVIDRNPRIRTSLRHILEYAGYHVVEACEALVALTGAQLREIDLVLLDLWRPGPACTEALHLLQTVRPTVKMIAMADDGRTADPLDAAAMRGTRAHWTLQKPVGAQDLLAAVQAVLAGT